MNEMNSIDPINSIDFPLVSRLLSFAWPSALCDGDRLDRFILRSLGAGGRKKPEKTEKPDKPDEPDKPDKPDTLDRFILRSLGAGGPDRPDESNK